MRKQHILPVLILAISLCCAFTFDFIKGVGIQALHLASLILDTPLSSSSGGTGVDSNGSSGVPKVTNGVWSVNATQDDLGNGTTFKQTHNDFTDEYKAFLSLNSTQMRDILGLGSGNDTTFNSVESQNATATLRLHGISLPLPIASGGTGNSTVATARTSLGAAPASMYDTMVLDVSAGMDAAVGAPVAATVLQGAVGSNLLASWANDSPGYDTFTSSTVNITSAINTGGTSESASSAAVTLTANKLYRIVATLTLNSGTAPTLTATNSSPAVSQLLVSGANTIYFMSTSTSTVLTVSQTAVGNWSCTFTVYEYIRPIIYRDYVHTAVKSLVFFWIPPLDFDGTLYFQPICVVSASTAPANGETVKFTLAGGALASSASMSSEVGSAITSTFTADATYAQYDILYPSLSSAVTIANWTVGKPVMLVLRRDVTDTYAQNIGFNGLVLKIGRTLAR